MNTNTASTLQVFGERIMDVWRGMRPATRSLVERALAANGSSPSSTNSAAPMPRRRALPYDAPAEADLSRLLCALDERLAEISKESPADIKPDQRDDLRRMIQTCAGVLQRAAQSAEAFALLLERALRTSDFRAVDSLANSLLAQLPPSEICELSRHTHPGVRALAREALAQVPASLLVELLADPVDADATRSALECQARDYESEEAQWVLEALCISDDDGLDD